MAEQTKGWAVVALSALLAGCGDGLTNQQIIAMTKECEAAGYKARAVTHATFQRRPRDIICTTEPVSSPTKDQP